MTADAKASHANSAGRSSRPRVDLWPSRAVKEEAQRDKMALLHKPNLGWGRSRLWPTCCGWAMWAGLLVASR